MTEPYFSGAPAVSNSPSSWETILMTGAAEEWPLRETEGMARSLIDALASVVWSSNSPVRSAMAFEYFRIRSWKGCSQMRSTLYSERFIASDTMRQPERRLPCGGTPSLAKTAMVS